MRKLVIRFNAPATLTFALLALGALLLGQTLGSGVTMKYFCVYRSSLADPLTYLRFFTHVLGHADYSHYMGNMLLLLLVGPPLEEKYGWKKMAWFMAVTALVTGLVQFIFFPHTALLGASGIVFMMIVLSSFTESRGGGIPVTVRDGVHTAVDAIVDKDLTSAILAWRVRADILVILTAVEKVYLDFGKPTQKALDAMTVSEARAYMEQGQFAPGSMLPKVQACVKFVEAHPGGRAVITSLDHAAAGLRGETGTLIVADGR